MTNARQTPGPGLWKQRVRRWVQAETLSRHEDKVMVMLTLLIGATVGIVVVAFILLTERLGARLYPAEGAAWRRLFFPTAGALATGFLLTRYFPNARGSGIPQTKVALFLRNGRILFRTVLGKFGCSSVSLASGIALGREGPAVQVGSGIASVLGRWLGLRPAKVKELVPIGSAAALAAAFNTPIAAVLFTLEEVMGNLHAPVLGGIVLSSATSWVVLHLLMGDEPLFHVPTYQMIHPLEFLVYAVLGIAGGLVSVCFVKLLLAMRGRFLRMPSRTTWWQPVVGGLLVGLLGWWVPQVLGVGYAHVGSALNGRMAFSLMALLLGLKVVATATCYASGNAGGIFGPSLFIGAMLGGTVGTLAHGLLPDYTGSPGVYALLGMGTAFAGIIRAPLTSVIMIFEITRDYSIVVPVMVANLLSYFISRRLQPEPIYEALLHQEGIHLPPGRKETETVPVLAAMQTAAHVLAADDPIPASAAALLQAPSSTPAAADENQRAWPVVDGNRLVGMVTRADIERAARREGARATLRELLPDAPIHGPIRVETFPHVHPDQPIDAAMRRMARSGLDVLPVVDRDNPRRLLGTISMGDIIKAYAADAVDIRPAEPETSRPAALLATVVAVLVGAFVLTGFLARYYHVQRETTARHFMEIGNDLARQNRTAEAIQQYRSALSLTHSNEDRLTLTMALIDADLLDDARIYAEEFHARAPGDGRGDVAQATIAARQGRMPDAVAWFRQATTAVWPDKTPARRLDARFALVDLLRTTGASRRALAELLAMADGATDTPTRVRIARQMLALGAPSEAAEVFRQVIHDAPREATAYQWLADARFAQAAYPAARDALRSAIRFGADDSAVRERLALVEKILALDPTVRGLRSSERHARSLKLLEGALGALEQCVALDGARPEAFASVIGQARAALSARQPPRSFGDATDANVALAERLWANREQACRAAPVDEALRRVLEEVSKRPAEPDRVRPRGRRPLAALRRLMARPDTASRCA